MQNFDFDYLRLDLISHLKDNGYSRNEFSRKYGIPSSTINRFISRQTAKLNSEHVAELCILLKVPVSRYTAGEGAITYFPNMSTIDKIRATIRSDKALSQIHKDALCELMSIAYKVSF